jgi:intracellular sulfur oxidation DsrE/DsrF family protein
MLEQTLFTPRALLSVLLGLSCLLNLAQAADQSAAPDEEVPAHRVVYQCSEPGPDAYSHLLFSVDQLKQKHGENIQIVVTCLGPGIHLLAKKPQRDVPPGALDKMEYLSLAGVEFHACGNTMETLGWTAADMHDFATIVPIGAEDLMLLQEQGFSYLKW